jgi:hypothetical protein
VSNGDIDLVLWTKSKISRKYQIHDKGRLPNAPYCYAYDIKRATASHGHRLLQLFRHEVPRLPLEQQKGMEELKPLPGGKNSEGIWLTDSG